MSNYITIDGGTTNTRVALLENGKVIEIIKLSAGAKAAIDNKELLYNGIEKAIKQLTEKYRKIKPECILVSGMLTSEFGLCEVPHIGLPAGIKELNENLHEKEMFGMPIFFIPGVKSIADDFLDTDMMRGEETELIGIMQNLPAKTFKNSVVVLPGSHSKFIYTDSDMRITKLTSLLTGEMLVALSENTILKDAVKLLSDPHSSEYLFKGYNYAHENGISAALLKVRILKNLFGGKENETYSFFLGIVLQPEIDELINSPAEKIIIAGRKQIKEAIAELLGEITDKAVITVPEEIVKSATFEGMVKIYEYK